MDGQVLVHVERRAVADSVAVGAAPLALLTEPGRPRGFTGHSSVGKFLPGSDVSLLRLGERAAVKTFGLGNVREVPISPSTLANPLFSNLNFNSVKVKDTCMKCDFSGDSLEPGIGFVIDLWA